MVIFRIQYWVAVPSAHETRACCANGTIDRAAFSFCCCQQIVLHAATACVFHMPAKQPEFPVSLVRAIFLIVSCC